jgi:hypothetical protein
MAWYAGKTAEGGGGRYHATAVSRMRYCGVDGTVTCAAVFVS